MFSPTTNFDKCLYDPLSAINRPPYEKYAVLVGQYVHRHETMASDVPSLNMTYVALSPPSESSNLYTYFIRPVILCA